MELYHQTLIQPSQLLYAISLHLYPIKPKEESQKPKQMLFAKTNSFELYHYTQNKSGFVKYQLKSFYKEELFSNICAVQSVQYLDEEMKKDFILITLSNGKYQLLEWMPQSSRCSLRDQGYVFSNQEEIQSGLCKPIPGHYISVNNEAKLVMIAAANWEFKIYSQTLGFGGLRLTSLLYFQDPINRTSICTQLIHGNGTSLFYSLRMWKNQGKKIVKVGRITRKQQKFQEESIIINDTTAHMLLAKGDSFAVFGRQNITYYSTKGKMIQVKIPQKRECFQSCYFRRTTKDKKQDYFFTNQCGELFSLIMDQTKSIMCAANQIQRIFAINHVVTLEKNIFFSVSASQDNYIFSFNGTYKIEDRNRAAKQKEDLTREQLLNPKYPQYKEIQILASQTSKIIRDMKVGNIEKHISSQIILTGGRPDNKKGFLSVLKYGLKVKQYLSASFVNPMGAWCLKKSLSDKHHSYIVFSFSSRKTSSYRFLNNTLSGTNQLKLQQLQATIHVNKFYDNSIVQVTPSKIRHIQKQKQNQNPNTNIKGRIAKAICVTEGKQLVILLIGGFMEYYELSSNKQLKLINEFNLDSEANFIDYAQPDIVDGKPVTRMIVIGKNNYHIAIYMLQAKGLELVLAKNIKCSIESLTVLPALNGYQIIAGTNIGKVIKFVINKNGDAGNNEETQVCSKSVKYSKINIVNKPSPIRICPQPTFFYQWEGQQQQCSLPIPNIEFIAEISIQDNENKCIFLTYFDNYLRFIEISGFGNLLQQYDKQIQYPGRSIVACADRLGILSEMKDKKEDKQTWKSLFCLFNPLKNYAIEQNFKFEQNEKCMCMCYIAKEQGKGYLFFGCVSEYQTYPTIQAQKYCIKVFLYQKDKDPLLTFLYSYLIDDIPTSMSPYLDKLLVGVGKKLVLYEVYSAKLVLKAVRLGLESYINNILTDGEKIVTSQVFNSFTVYRLNLPEKSFDYIGQDMLPKFLSTSYLIDENYGVIAGGDKFGNFFVNKFSQKIKNQFQTGTQNKYNQFADCSKLESLVSYNMGQVLTSIQSGFLNERRPKSIFYSTIDGRIGMLYPFQNQQLKEVLFLQKLQEELQKSYLVGSTNHRQFRSFYNPAKGIIDGDFCKLYENLSQNDKNKIANNLQVEPKYISSLIILMQNKFK